MDNTIRVQDHPLVALQNRNIQAQDEYNYWNHMTAEEQFNYDFENGLIDPGPVPFDDKDTESILNDLPF